MPDPLEIAIRAEESARAAHNRLDRMNGSIDRLTREVNTAKQEILRRLDRQDGIDEGTQKATNGFLDSKRFYITLIALAITSSVAALILPLLFRSH